MSGNVTRAHHGAFASAPRAARIAAAKGADLWRDESICPIPSLNWKDAAAGRSATSTAAAAAAAGASAVDGDGGAALVMSEVCPIPPVLWRVPPRAHELLGRGPPNARAASPPARIAHVAVSRGGGGRSRRIVPRSCSLDDGPVDGGGGGAGATPLLKPNWPLGRSSSVDDVIPPSDAHDSASPIFLASGGGTSSGGGGGGGGGGCAFASSGSRGHRRRHSAVPDLGRNSATCGISSDSGGLAAGSTAGTSIAAGDASIAAAAAAIASSTSGAVAAGSAALAGHPRWNPLHRGGSMGVGGHTARDHSPARRSRLIRMRQAAGHGRRSSWDGTCSPDPTSTATSNEGQRRGAVAAASSSCECTAMFLCSHCYFSLLPLCCLCHLLSESQSSLILHPTSHLCLPICASPSVPPHLCLSVLPPRCVPSLCDMRASGVEQLCESMQAAGIAIDSIDIIALPLGPSIHSSTHSHARAAATLPPPPTAVPTPDSVHAAAGKPPTPAAALAAVCEPAAGVLKPCSLHPVRTAACTGPASHPPAAAAGAAAVGGVAGAGAGGYGVSLAVRFCGMSTWYHPGDNTTTPAFQH
ncbi:unnamed protein product [Closterium sp. Yama58-4]|nr:unnamed protein product [Closterium sp. Yama58-4]